MMETKFIELKLETYGLGDVYDPDLWTPIRNDWIKPRGGLWASPVGSEYSWSDWCREADFGDLSTRFETLYRGNTLVIDVLDDLNKLYWQDHDSLTHNAKPDFVRMVRDGVDAIWLTEKGQWATRLTHPLNLYGWDCESVIVMNPNTIKGE